MLLVHHHMRGLENQKPYLQIKLLVHHHMRGLETLKALWGKGLRVHHHMRGLEKENRLDEKEATRSPPHAWLRNTRQAHLGYKGLFTTTCVA